MHILLVEDNPTDALLVEVALEEMSMSAQVTHVETLACAEQLLEQQGSECEPFDTALLDLNLPDGDGLSNFERLQEKAPTLPIIVLTGLDDQDVAIEAIRRGAADFLLKGEAGAALLERSLRYSIERRRHETSRLELARAQIERAEAEAANRAKDHFLATISHELRTPLNAMLGWATLLRSNELDAETTSRALDIIERNARLQAQLIEDLLDVSRIVAGNFRLELAEVDLNAVVRAAAESLTPQADSKGVDLRIELGTVPPLQGDSMRLQQVAWNLLSNAVKFTPEGGWARICTRCEESEGRKEVVLEVTDSGQGIAPDFLPRVFERFRQADDTQTRRYGGLGIGLSIVQQIVMLHGGTVGVCSDGPGKGAQFWARVPLQEKEEALA